jgi:regulatory protein
MLGMLLLPRAWQPPTAVLACALRQRGAVVQLCASSSAAGAGAGPESPVVPSSHAAGERAVARALVMLRSRLRSCAEVAARLAEEAHAPPDAAHAVARLAAVRLLDDDALARALARYKWKAGWARQRVRHHILSRLVPPAAAERALDELFGEGGEADSAAGAEVVALLSLARPRWRSSRNLAFEARERRLVGWLARRGHGWRVVRDVVQQLSAEEAAKKREEGGDDGGDDESEEEEEGAD